MDDDGEEEGRRRIETWIAWEERMGSGGRDLFVAVGVLVAAIVVCGTGCLLSIQIFVVAAGYGTTLEWMKKKKERAEEETKGKRRKKTNKEDADKVSATKT